MTARAHHRFRVHGHQGQLTLAVGATLSAPWTVLFGPSGSGKSTVLRALTGLAPGLHTTFERHEAATLSWSSLAPLPPQQRRLAYAPQQGGLLPHLTVEDNIRFPEVVRHLTAGQSQLPTLIPLLALEPLLRKRPARLSGGERQRVALARALAVPKAGLFLLDEPFSGLDRALRDELLPRLRAYLNTRGLPVLSVTHDPDEVLLLGAEVLRLADGHLVAQGAAAEVLADEIVRLTAILSPLRTT